MMNIQYQQSTKFLIMSLKSNVKKSLTFLSLAVFVASGLVSCTPQKPAKEVGLQLWSVKDDMKTDAKGTIEKVMANREVFGARIAVAGRLGGAEMARREQIRKGGIPLQTLPQASLPAEKRVHPQRPEPWAQAKMIWSSGPDRSLSPHRNYLQLP